MMRGSTMFNMSRLVELLEEQRKLELSHVERLRPTLEATQNRLASAVIESIIYDSHKHAALCGALAGVEAGAVPVKMEMDTMTALRLAQSVRQHIRVEEEMIGRLEKILELVRDDRVAELLGYLLQDERRHHSMLTRLAVLLDREETSIDEYLSLAQKYMFIQPP